MTPATRTAARSSTTPPSGFARRAPETGGATLAPRALDAVRQRIALASGAGGAKRHLLHPFNGRFHPIDHAALDVLIDAMVARIDVTAVNYVLGFPEGGSVPTYAFARVVYRPVILASRLPLDLPGRVAFEQPQANLGTTQYVWHTHGTGPRIALARQGDGAGGLGPSPVDRTEPAA